MRRLLASLLLPLIMLLSQQGGLLHEIRHAQARVQSSESGKSLPSDGFCFDCLSYAQLGHGPASTLVPLALQALDHVLPTLALPGGLGLSRPHARSRGPPLAL